MNTSFTRFTSAAFILLLAACTPAVPDGTASSSSSSSSMSDLIQVDSPLPNATVASPLTVTGRARGTWYFEASFPVKLLDGNGNQIVIEPAQAQSDWMTMDFVPFTVTLTFPTPATPTGMLVLMKDNPSGELQNDASVSIPVVF